MLRWEGAGRSTRRTARAARRRPRPAVGDQRGLADSIGGNLSIHREREVGVGPVAGGFCCGNQLVDSRGRDRERPERGGGAGVSFVGPVGRAMHAPNQRVEGQRPGKVVTISNKFGTYNGHPPIGVCRPLPRRRLVDPSAQSGGPRSRRVKLGPIRVTSADSTADQTAVSLSTFD